MLRFARAVNQQCQVYVIQQINYVALGWRHCRTGWNGWNVFRGICFNRFPRDRVSARRSMEKLVIVCGLPFTKIWKSFLVKLPIARPLIQYHHRDEHGIYVHRDFWRSFLRMNLGLPCENYVGSPT
jgi:hypothetical protein